MKLVTSSTHSISSCVPVTQAVLLRLALTSVYPKEADHMHTDQALDLFYIKTVMHM